MEQRVLGPESSAAHGKTLDQDGFVPGGQILVDMVNPRLSRFSFGVIMAVVIVIIQTVAFAGVALWIRTSSARSQFLLMDTSSVKKAGLDPDVKLCASNSTSDDVYDRLNFVPLPHSGDYFFTITDSSKCNMSSSDSWYSRYSQLRDFAFNHIRGEAREKEIFKNTVEGFIKQEGAFRHPDADLIRKTAYPSMWLPIKAMLPDGHDFKEAAPVDWCGTQQFWNSYLETFGNLSRYANQVGWGSGNLSMSYLPLRHLGKVRSSHKKDPIALSEPVYRVEWSKVSRNDWQWLLTMADKIASPDREWPCRVPSHSCKEYACFAQAAPKCAEEIVCSRATLNVQMVSRPSITDAMISSGGLLGYYEMLATGLVVMIYMTYSRGMGWCFDKSEVSSFTRIVTEAEARQNVQLLREDM